MMQSLGSAFLGDVGRNRRISSPPSTPSPTHSRGPSSIMTDVFTARQGVTSPATASPTPAVLQSSTTRPSRPVIEPALSLELRIRWLEALIMGVRQDGKGKEKEKLPEAKSSATLVRLTEDVQTRLAAAVESNEGLKRFMQQYDQQAHLLTPSFVLSGTLPGPVPSYEDMSPAEIEALLAEMEPDIRAADRDMREIEMLEKKGATGAGKLINHESLQPRLLALLKAHEEDLAFAASLERRIAVLMEKHATQVDALSELFVAWDDALTDAEAKVAKMEREKQDRPRLGLV